MTGTYQWLSLVNFRHYFGVFFHYNKAIQIDRLAFFMIMQMAKHAFSGFSPDQSCPSLGAF